MHGFIMTRCDSHIHLQKMCLPAHRAWLSAHAEGNSTKVCFSAHAYSQHCKVCLSAHACISARYVPLQGIHLCCRLFTTTCCLLLTRPTTKSGPRVQQVCISACVLVICLCFCFIVARLPAYCSYAHVASCTDVQQPEFAILFASCSVAQHLVRMPVPGCC